MNASVDAQGGRPELGIIAGGGVLPARLVHACDKKNIIPFIVGFEGQTDPDLVKGRYHLWARLGQAGKVIQTLKAHDIKDIVLIGNIKRPSLDELRPDWKTAHILARIGFRALGDDGLLKALRKELENEGFRVKGVQEYVENLLAQEGQYGKCAPTQEHWEDIEKGCRLGKKIGLLDIGQACIVQQGIVLGVEAAEGTNELIKRCALLKRKGQSPILVKVSKPGQDKNLDLPTLGPQTVEYARQSGLGGIVMEARNTLVIGPDETAYAADKAGMFLIGVTLDEFGRLKSKSAI